MEQIDLANVDVFFVSQMTLHIWLTFPHGSLTVNLTVLLIWIYSFLLRLVFLLQSLFLLWEIMITLLPLFPFTFFQTQKMDAPFLSLCTVFYAISCNIDEVL